MIKSFEVNSLNGIRGADYKFEFHNDLNILTGRNGSGKTTLMKLLWYMLSPNRRVVYELINFESARVVTDSYELIVQVDASLDDGGSETLKWTLSDGISSYSARFRDMLGIRGMDEMDNFDSMVEQIGDQHTVFFPTFRRLEGGFETITGARFHRRQRRGGPFDDLSEYLKSYSQELSSRNHIFVTSMSTRDIENLISDEYAVRTEKTNKAYLSASLKIEELINSEDQKKNASHNTGDIVSAMGEMASTVGLMDSIKDILKKAKDKDTDNRKPFKVLSQMVSEVFNDKTIRISPTLGFGNADKKVGANKLSAGEKQMFGFLSYNALLKNAIIFIDEPELSLHVDWQRIMFRKLMEQGSNNQFIVATHSPFIYSQYPQKELFLGVDRGFANNRL